MISQSTFQFLKELKQHNDRDWFNDNKPRYEAAKLEFEQFIDALIPAIAVFDPGVSHHTAKDCVFRIYRDVRFSHDKSPYKTHFGAHITPAANKSEINSQAGYYVHLEPGESILGGGAYRPTSGWLNAIRKEIDINAGDLKKIVGAGSFKKYFGEIEGEKLKTSPRGYPADHPEIELLRFKSFLAVHSLDDEKVLTKDFLQHCVKVFEALSPFDHYLNGLQPEAAGG